MTVSALLSKAVKCLLHPSIIFNKLFGDTKWYQQIRYKVLYYRIRQYLLVQKIHRENRATVVFFAATVSMWRYQKLYEILKTDERFKVYVVVTTFASFTEDANRIQKEQLCCFFNNNHVDFLLLEDITGGISSLNPDIIFYIQPYEGIIGDDVCYTHFKDKLLAYYPYGLQNVYKKWGYNTEFHNLAWRLFYPTVLHKQNAKALSAVKGKNVVVVGEPHADDYSSPIVEDPWKDKGKKKRIVWAPHFQIVPNKMFYRPSFLWTFDLMLEIAEKYKESISIAFKPHPRLYPTLCQYPGWGKERTDKYYALWKEMDNTQFEDGDFVDLFKTSDAIIHDCGSFTAEYQYTMKPCMFLTRDYRSVFDELCPFGKLCLDNHYIGENKDDIIRFIEDIVLLGNDPKGTQRKYFYKNYLQPPYNRSTAQNTYDDIVSCLFD